MNAGQAYQVFATRSGYCRLYESRIEITHEDWGNKLFSRVFGGGYGQLKWLYILLIMSFLLSAMLALAIKNYFITLFLLGMAAVYVWMWWQKRDISIATMIRQEDVEEIEFHEAVPGESRPRFVIVFRKNHRRRLRRIINLPGGEQSALLVENAKQMMKSFQQQAHEPNTATE